ncbi:MAG: rhodanese-like domain-containing protein [Planctomycetes bacterium]|nr:rhodanese-like domain-containing protein [Planctomycetota bacterium]
MLVEHGARVLDVRTPMETAGGVIPGAVCIPVNELPERLAELPKNHATTLVVCAMGVRSAAACQYLSEQGYDGLVNLDGGMSRWTGEKARPQ